MHDDEDKTGYKNPPKQHQFRKGKSGNPKGRPKEKSSLSDKMAVLSKKKITAFIRGKRRRITTEEAFIRCLINNAVQGSMRAFKTILDILPKQKETWILFVDGKQRQQPEDEDSSSIESGLAGLLKILLQERIKITKDGLIKGVSMADMILERFRHEMMNNNPQAWAIYLKYFPNILSPSVIPLTLKMGKDLSNLPPLDMSEEEFKRRLDKLRLPKEEWLRDPD